MTPRMRTGTTIAVGAALLFSVSVGAVAADDGGAPSQALTAQEESTAFGELLRAGGLQRGDDIYVTEAVGRRLRGNVIDASAAALSVSDGRKTWTLAPSEIRKIERHDSVATGTCLGLAIGFGGWVGACRGEAQISGADTCYRTLHAFLPALAAGGLLGWHLDRRMRRTVYEATGSGRLAISPLLSPGRHDGVCLVVMAQAAEGDGGRGARRLTVSRSGAL